MTTRVKEDEKFYATRIAQGFAIMHGMDDSIAGVQHQTFSGDRLNGFDNALDNWYNPLLNNTVRQIAQEVEQMRQAGMLRPFTEGEHVGALPRRVHSKKVTDAQVAKFYKQRKEEQREVMLQLRARNDESIRSLLRSI